MRQLSNSATHMLATCMRAVVFFSAICAATPASAAEDAVVEALIQRGIQLRRNNADDEALAVFLEAERQDPTSVRVLLHVVTAAQGAGKWLMADSYMRKVSALKDDPYYRRHADAIDVVGRAISARVGSFHAEGGPDGASVRLDGQLVGTLPMDQPTSVEAGAYLMEVHKPGYYRLRRNVTISGGVLTREPVELNRAVVRGDLGAGSGAAGAIGDETNDSNSSIDRGDRAWWESPAVGWTFIGLGAASGVVSSIAFITRENRVESWNDEGRCLTQMEPTSTRLANCEEFKDDAEAAQSVGIITGITGAVLIGAGITHLLATGESEASPANTSASVGRGLKLTGCDAGLLSVACHGSF